MELITQWQLTFTLAISEVRYKNLMMQTERKVAHYGKVSLSELGHDLACRKRKYPPCRDDLFAQNILLLAKISNYTRRYKRNATRPLACRSVSARLYPWLEYGLALVRRGQGTVRLVLERSVALSNYWCTYTASRQSGARLCRRWVGSNRPPHYCNM